MPYYRLVIERNEGSTGICAPYATWRIDRQEKELFLPKPWVQVGPTYHSQEEAELAYMLLTQAKIPKEIVLKTTKQANAPQHAAWW